MRVKVRMNMRCCREPEEDEKGEEDAGHTGHVGRDQQVPRGGGEVEVAMVGAEQDAADDVEDVVDGQLLRDGLVQGRRPRGGGVEPGERVAEQLGGWQEQVDREEAEDLAQNAGGAHQTRPLAGTSAFAEPQEGGEERLTAHAGHHPGSGNTK